MCPYMALRLLRKKLQHSGFRNPFLVITVCISDRLGRQCRMHLKMIISLCPFLGNSSHRDVIFAHAVCSPAEEKVSLLFDLRMEAFVLGVKLRKSVMTRC